MTTSIENTECEQAFRLHLDEASAVCMRNGSSLLAVGDKDLMVTTADLDGHRCSNEHSRWVGDILDRKESDSQWEAIATDGEGRVFIVEEKTSTVTVFSRDLDERLHEITLHSETEQNENAGPEALVLLEDGRLLTVQQKGPAQLIEFGPSSGSGFEPSAYLTPQAGFRLCPADRVTLVELHRWDLVDDTGQEVPSVNDLALDPHRRLHAVSSLSQCIYELPRRSREDKLVATSRWRLPDNMELCQHRKAEGLAFDPDGRPLVLVDTKLRDNNFFMLGALPR